MAVLQALLVMMIAAFAALSSVCAAPAGSREGATVDFSGPAAIIELRDRLVPYHAPSGDEADGSVWYMLTAINGSVRPVTRVLLAQQPANADWRVWPMKARPLILQVAASDSQVIVEDARAHGRHAFRVTIPPATTVTLAIRVRFADPQPSILAWTEPALVSHSRQLAVFLAAVASMIAATMAITMGLAVMTGHRAPFWASIFLALMFALRLSGTGSLDAGWATQIGGPYGLEVTMAGLALAAGLKFSDTIVPMSAISWIRAEWPNRAALGIATIAFLAFLGIPGGMILSDILIVLLPLCMTGYFIDRGRRGEVAARVAAPSAAVFSLVAIGTAVVALGAFPDNEAAPAIVGGFTAAGAVLLVLAVAAGEGIAILPASRYGMAREHSPPPGGQSADIPPPAASSAIGASHQGVFELDFAGDVLQLSREAAGLLGSPGGALTLPHGVWMDRIHPDDQAVYRAAIHDYRGHPGTAFRVEFRVRSEGGRFPWMELRATMMGEGASADRCLGLMADVTARKDAEAAVMDRTIRDPLTGLGNRVGLMETLERYDGHLADTTFAVLDIDRFKSVHTSLGDAGADAVLSGLARRIFKKFEGSAAVFRVGGDAFAVLMGTAGHDAGAIGADLIEACKPPFEQNGRNIFVSASVGIAAGTDARDALDLLKNAELALIQAKRQGGARACIYASTMESLAPGDAVALEADLRQALRDNQLDVYYQPIMRLGDGTIAGFEALVRWLHPEKGPIEPSEFVPHCEETGLIVAIGRLALERAVTDVSQWQRYFPLDPPLFVSVNLSRRQLFDDELESVLKDVLAKNGPVSGTVQLEVTETAIAHSDDAKAILSRLRSAGVGLAIDDFGTGTANFQQLKDLPFDTVKVDRSFLAQRSGKSEARGGGVILSSIVNLAHDLHRDVVVEGVESEDEAVWLRALGCEYGQGFHFGAPMPREGVLEFISRHYRVDTAQA